MKILIAGYWGWYQYEEAFSIALRELKHEVIRFDTSNYFYGKIGKIQEAVPIPGPAMIRINKDLVKLATKEQPDLFLAWRCTHLFNSTYDKLRSINIITTTYNNDDPFGPSAHGNVPWHHHFLWFWYTRNLKSTDFNFFYRSVNVREAIQLGATHAKVLLPYFIPWKDYPILLNEDEKKEYDSDLVFVGHYENDNRVNYLRCLVNIGLKVKLYGGKYWDEKVLGNLYKYFYPIFPVNGIEYNKVLCGAKICIVFLSKINRDTYTRRCFEIPACGRVMLAERTKELMEMFEENVEACYFSNEEELVEKALWLLKNNEIRLKMEKAALKKIWQIRGDICSRAEEFVNSCK